jgi:succinate dehydrogenase / fumarate reductase cytochrome b subunit
MSASSSSNLGRPLSPHLGIWRWGPAMAVSILHRVAGNAMAFVGLPLLVWFVASLAGGEAAWVPFARHMGAWYGMVVLVGLSWAFFEHLTSGLRHFVLDIGAGYEVHTNNFWAWLVPVIAIALTAAFWAAILLR